MSSMAIFTRAEARIIPVPESGCWLWLGELNRNGYARMSINGRKVMMHRWIFEFLARLIPSGLVLDHRCRVRCCVNPDHLEPVTVRVNTLRGNAVLFGSASQKVCALCGGTGHTSSACPWKEGL